MAEATKPSTGFSIYDMLADPNIQLLMANMGASMVPEGYAGNVIGKAAANMIQSKAAQKAGEQQLNEDDSGVVTKKLGPFTPKGTTGPNSVKRTSNGSLDLNVDHPNADALVTSLGGYSPLGTEGVNSVRRTTDGSLLVNYDPPRTRSLAAQGIADEVDVLAAAPTSARDATRLSYSPVSQNQLQTEIDSTLNPFYGRRRVV